jgi:hypothetical protein
MSLTVGAWGPTKVGKTTFMFSAPGLAIAEFDIGGIERGSTKAQREAAKITQFYTPIQIATPGQHMNKGLTGFSKCWMEFLNWYMGQQGVISADSIETIGIDTGTILYNIRTDSELEEIQKRNPERKMLDKTEYKSTNSDFYGLAQHSKQKNKNLIMLFEERDIYVTGVNDQGKSESMPSGEMEHKGWSSMPYNVDVVLKFGIGKDKKPEAIIQEVGKGSTELRGLVIPEPTWERLNELLDIAQKLKEEGIPIPDSYQSLIQTAKAAKII